MHQQIPSEVYMRRYISLSKAKAHLGQLIDELDRNGGEVVLTRNRRPSAILMTVDEFESWQETKEIVSDPELMREIRHGLRQLESGETFTFEDIFGEPL